MANQATGLTCIIKAAGYSYKGLFRRLATRSGVPPGTGGHLLAIILAVWLDVGAIARIY